MDVRLRLCDPAAGDRFTFICSAGQEAAMVKVIAHGNGQILERREEAGGILMTVAKKGGVTGIK